MHSQCPAGTLNAVTSLWMPRHETLRCALPVALAGHPGPAEEVERQMLDTEMVKNDGPTTAVVMTGCQLGFRMGCADRVSIVST